MKEEVYKNIKDTDEFILTLKKLYQKIMMQRQLLSNKENIGKEDLDQYARQVEKNISELIDNIQTEDSKKIQMLEGIIEETLETEENSEIKEKINNIFRDYYKLLKKQGEKIKEPNRDEKIVLNLINGSNAKIYEDKSENDKWKYGDLFRRMDKTTDIIYHDKNMLLLNKATYQVTRTKKEPETAQNKVVASVSKAEISKYEFKIRYDANDMASIEFFADIDLGEQIKDGNLEYISPMLAAIAKAKEQGREHIGRISIIDEELGTFVTQYDNELEASVKRLKTKENSKQIKNVNKGNLEEVKE